MPVGKPFAKGKSGNPAGRSKKQLALQELIRTFAESQLEENSCGNKLVDQAWFMARTGEVGALKLLFEYGYGKAPQKIQHTVEGNVTVSSDAELEAIIRRGEPEYAQHNEAKQH